MKMNMFNDSRFIEQNKLFYLSKLIENSTNFAEVIAEDIMQNKLFVSIWVPFLNKTCHFLFILTQNVLLHQCFIIKYVLFCPQGVPLALLP